MASPQRIITLNRVVRAVTIILLVAGAIYLVNTLRNVLLPFFLACLIAYMLEPLVNFNRRVMHLRGRVVASLLTIVEVSAVLAIAGYFFVPAMLSEIHQLDALLVKSRGADASSTLLPPSLTEPLQQWLRGLNLNEVVRNSHFASLIDSGGSFIAATVDRVLHGLEWLLTFIYVIFILIDYPTFTNGFRSMVPERFRATVYRMASDIASNMNRYFRCQAFLALCAAILYSIGFSIVGLPMAIVMGILVGVLYIIPYFQYVTVIPVAAICIVDAIAGGGSFWREFGECLLVYAVSQTICDYILTPRIMGKALGLNPAIILLSLSVWGSLMGIIGMIVALPLTALLLSYYRRYFIDRDTTPSSSDPSTPPDSTV